MGDTIKSLAGSMLTAAQKVVDTAKYDRTRRGIIKSVQSSGYVVDVYGIEYTASGTPGAHKVGDVVSVLFEQNNPDTCLVLNSYARTAIDDLIMVRPNLLDNWYFAGGGFPVNQRGEASYGGTNNIMTVDRWALRKSSSSSATVTPSSDGLVFVGDSVGISSGGLTGLNQPIENKEMFAGQTVTISALVKNVTVSASNQLSLRLTSANGRYLHSYNHGSVYINGDGLVSRTLTVNAANVAAYSHLNFGFMLATNQSASMTIIAVKMELGDTQTLARLENGEWVLNELPNYQEQLARCQRHLYVANTYGAPYARFGLGATTSTTAAEFLVHPPVPMRTVPTLDTAGTLQFVRQTNTYTGTLAADTDGATPDAISLVATIGSGTWTAGAPIWVRAANDTSARLIFSAEL